MPHVHSLHIGLGGKEYVGIKPAPLLADPDLTATFCQRFRKLLSDYPLQFLDRMAVQGHAPVSLQWAALCRTAGLLWLRSDAAEVDAISLLLNGVETADEIEAVARHSPMFAPHWQAIAAATKPLAVNGYMRVSRMQDSAVTTILSTFANAYFVQFGTNV